jgi:hypothetical protein
MKTDKVLDRLTKRLDNLICGSSPVSKRDVIISNKTTQQELYGIETQKYGEPLRFSDYRHARCKKTKPAVGITCEDMYDTITQEELDWSLRQQLKVSPEDRYQHGKEHWYSHPMSWYVRVPHKGYDG